MALTVCWSPPLRPGRTLFVAFGYHGADRDGERRGWLERFESSAARGHRIVHRDHYANPRPLPYVMSMIVEAAGILCPDQAPDLVLDTRYAESLPPAIAARFGQVVTVDVVDERQWDAVPLARGRNYDHVVLVYPDALGLGCEAGERAARRTRDEVLVLNGRRRAFRLDSALARRLRLHRLLARTRIVERGLAIAARPVAAALAWLDRTVSVRP